MMLADETILYWFGSHRIFGRCLLVVVLVLCSGGVNGADDSVEFFEKKIRPVLVEHCYQCHGAESKELQGELRLDVKAGWQLGGVGKAGDCARQARGESVDSRGPA